MRIFIPVLDFSRSGGARVLAKLASEWKRGGHEAVFLANEHSEPPYFPTEAGIWWLDDGGVRLERPPAARARGGGANVLRNLRCLKRALARYAGPGDVVLANNSLTPWPAWLSRCGAKLVYYIQAYEPEYYEVRPGLSAKVLELMAWGSYLLPFKRVVNGDVYLRYRNLRSEHVVPPVVDYALFRPVEGRACDRDLTRGTVKLGCIGRREPSKGIAYVIEAFHELLKRGRDVELHVAYGNIDEDVASHPRVRVSVPKNDAELAQFYRSLDVVLAPGVGQHGAPHYPVMEGMACGVPVVTTGYLPSDPANSWEVPERDAKAVADAVESIIEDPAERRRRVERALEAMKPFGWPEVAAQMLALLRS